MDNQERASREKELRAIRKGNFQNDFGVDVDCFVLNDEERTAVISQVGMGKSLGLSERSSALPRFISGKAISKYVNAELKKKLENPLVFQGLTATPGVPLPIVHGYDVTNLIDICKAILTARANGELSESRYYNVVKQAQILTSASAKAGIKGLVYAITGYNATDEERIRSFSRYVAEEAKEYEREFPSQLYIEWCRLYDTKMPLKNKPWLCLHLTREHVYEPLCNSDGALLKLLREAKGADRKNRNKKLFQFLETIGTSALRLHLGQLLGIARTSKTAKEYEADFATLFGKHLQLTLEDYPNDDEFIEEVPLSDFDKNIKKALAYKE
jgi:hypothetical protein